MEFEEFKDAWKSQKNDEPLQEVRSLLGKKSRSPIATMKRHLTMELIAVIILYAAIIIYYLTAFHGKFYSISVLYLFIGLFFCLYYYKKYRLLNNIECMACQVKSNLTKQVGVLEKYTKFYVLAGTAILPLLVVFFYWFEYAFIAPDRNKIFLLPSDQVSIFKAVAVFLLWMTIPTIIFYYINKWYVRKLYGKHVEQLKQMLLQTEDEGNNS